MVIIKANCLKRSHYLVITVGKNENKSVHLFAESQFLPIFNWCGVVPLLKSMRKLALYIMRINLDRESNSFYIPLSVRVATNYIMNVQVIIKSLHSKVAFPTTIFYITQCKV